MKPGNLQVEQGANSRGGIIRREMRASGSFIPLDFVPFKCFLWMKSIWGLFLYHYLIGGLYTYDNEKALYIGVRDRRTS